MRNREVKYFLYARKSSESEDRQVNSIEDQIKEVQKIAKRLKLNIVDVYKESMSAKAPGRKMFDEMLMRIEQGEADGILCWKLNRLARNPVDGGKISWLLQNRIIKHIQCYDRDYKPTDNVLTMQVDLGIGNQFIIDLREDVIRGMRDKAERGWYPFGTLPIGYIHNKDNKGIVHKTEIIEDEQKFLIVKKLWKLMLTGAYPIAEIKRKGDTLGLTNNNGKPYCIHTYHNLFKNEFYCGYFYWKDENGEKKKHTGKHKKMVTEAQFDKVQLFIANHKNPTRKRTYDFTFRGLLSCGECGCKITAERKFQVRCTGCRYKFSCINRVDCPKCNLLIADMLDPTIIDRVYYRCTKRKGVCHQKTTNEMDLKDQYLKALKDIEINKEIFNLLLEEIQKYNDTLSTDEIKIASQLKKRKSELENRLKGLAILVAEGNLETESYLSIKTETISEIKTLNNNILSATRNIINWADIANNFLKFALNATKVLEKADNFTIRAMLMQLGSNQTLFDGKLQFIRPKPLLAIKDCASVYEGKNSKFEPKNHLVKQSDLGDLNIPNLLVCTPVHTIRTAILSENQNIDSQKLA